MWALILFSLLLGCLFLYLAVRSFLRRQEWRNAVRLNARVAEVQYREARRKGDIIDDGRSSAVVTLRFFYEGREWTEQKEYRGIVGSPVCGQTVPICLNRWERTWATWREVRSYWGLLLALSVLCLQITAALLIDGRGILAALSDFQVKSPNLPGSLFLAMIGAILAACAYACVRGLLPSAVRPILAPICWAVKDSLGRLEPVEARCEGVICRETGDDDVSYYPLFSALEGGRIVRWYSGDSVSRKKYRAGEEYTLYRDRNTGTYTLAPTTSDVVRIPFSLIPLGFGLMLFLALAVSSAGMLYLAACGLLRV